MVSHAQTAKAIIRLSDNHYLALQSSKWEERPDRSQKPDLPGGMVEPGETARDGVVREVFEETGIRLEPSDVTLVYAETEYFEDTETSIVKHIFLADVSSDEVTLSWEHESYQWLDRSAFIATHWRPFYRRALDYLTLHGVV